MLWSISGYSIRRKEYLMKEKKEIELNQEITLRLRSLMGQIAKLKGSIETILETVIMVKGDQAKGNYRLTPDCKKLILSEAKDEPGNKQKD